MKQPNREVLIGWLYHDLPMDHMLCLIRLGEISKNSYHRYTTQLVVNTYERPTPTLIKQQSKKTAAHVVSVGCGCLTIMARMRPC